MLVLSGHTYIGHILWEVTEFPRSAPEDVIPLLVKQWQFGRTKSSQGFNMAKEAWLEDTSSGFGGEQSTVLTFLLLGLPLQDHFYSNVFRKANHLSFSMGFYVSRCCLDLFSIKRAEETINSGKTRTVQSVTGAPRVITGSKSPVCGKRQW